MMDILTPANIIAYGLQVTVLAALASVAAVIVHVDSAGIRYLYWRAVLAISLILPWLQPVRTAPRVDAVAVASPVATTAATMSAAGPLPLAAAEFAWLPLLTVILVLGILARLVWVGAGVVSLRRLRALATSIDLRVQDEAAALQAALGTRAVVGCVAGLAQPATFGFFRPVVLLPDSVGGQQPEIQRALLAHELIHVQRNDWLWVLCEELLLAVLWFNPATWWTVAQVRRAREEAVDELAILVTGSRRHYVKALLAFAGGSTLSPAPAFAYRRHLFRRITLISTEAVMSSNRIVLSCAVMAAVLLAGSWAAVGAFPLIEPSQTLQDQAAGPVEKRANPVSAENPVPKRTDYQPVDYPAEARAIGVSGAITMRITLDELGRVVESRRTIFSLQIVNPQMTATFSNTSPERLAEFVDRSNAGQSQPVLRALEAMTAAAAHAVSQWRYEPPKNGPIAFDVAINFKLDGETNAVLARGYSSPVVAVGEPLRTEGAVRVGGDIKAPTKIKDVRPIYPPEAQAAKVRGMVILEVRIGPDGSVEAAQVLRSVPLLDQAAIEAVRQWKFTPTLLNGAPIPVIMTVTVNFTLQ